MDIADRSAKLQEMYNRHALAQQAKKPTTAPSIYCIDCEEEIPAQRRKIAPHACRCIECQRQFEKWNNR